MFTQIRKMYLCILSYDFYLKYLQKLGYRQTMMQTVSSGRQNKQNIEEKQDLSRQTSPQKDSKYSELQSQIQKIRKIKDEYEFQKKEIQQLSSRSISPQQENKQRAKYPENRKQIKEKEKDFSINERNLKEKQQILRKNHQLRVQEIERRLEDICKLSSDQNIETQFCRQNKQRIDDSQNISETYHCPDNACQFQKIQKSRQHGLIRYKNPPLYQSFGHKTTSQNPESLLKKIHHHSPEFSPQKLLIENFINELHEKISHKNTIIQTEKQQNLEYREYISLCQQQNEKLVEMNTKLADDCDLKDQQYAIMKDEFNLCLQAQHLRDHKNMQLCFRMKEAQRKWDSQFEKMEEIYARVISKSEILRP